MKKTVVYLLMFILLMSLLTGCEGNADVSDDSNEQQMGVDGQGDDEYEINDDYEEDVYEVDVSYPDSSAYDEILIEEDGYYLCTKIQAGFSDGGTLLGIYDGNQGKWTVDFVDVPGGSENKNNIRYKGSGVFMFLDDASSKTVFISSDKGSYFSINLYLEELRTTVGEGDRFRGKYLPFYSGTNMKDYGPSNEIYVLDTMGNLTCTGMKDMKEFRSSFFYSTGGFFGTNENGFAVGVDNDENPTFYLLYSFDSKKVIKLNEEYSSKVTWDSEFWFEPTSVIIQDMVGADGQLYYMALDYSGNIIKEPTLMETIKP